MDKELEQIKLFYSDNLVTKRINNDVNTRLDKDDAEVLFNIGLPNSKALDFNFTKEIKYFQYNENELVLDDSEDGKIIYNLSNETIYLYFPSNNKRIILNIGLFQFLYSIYYYDLFLQNWESDKKNRTSYFNEFKDKMKLLNNNYSNLDYYWEAIIEEFSSF